MSDGRVAYNNIIRKSIRKKGPIRVIVCVITIGAFLFTTIGGELLLERAWAARTPLELPTVGSKWHGAQASFEEFDAQSFVLPKDLGEVRVVEPINQNSTLGVETVSKAIIHIQDSHCNYYAHYRMM